MVSFCTKKKMWPPNMYTTFFNTKQCENSGGNTNEFVKIIDFWRGRVAKKAVGNVQSKLFDDGAYIHLLDRLWYSCYCFNVSVICGEWLFSL